MIHWSQRVWGRDYRPIRVPADDPNLLCGYDMHPVGGVVPDLSGHGNDGAVTLFAPQGRTILGPALDFDGRVAGGLIDTGLTFAELNPRTADYTVECWFRSRALLHNKPIIGKGESGNYSNWINGGMQVLSNGALYYYQYTGAAYQGIACSPIVVDKLHHVAYTVDWSHGQVFAYLDGVQFGPIAPNMTAHAPSDAINWYVGHSGSVAASFDESFGGPIAAPRFYNRVLTPEEIRGRFMAGARARQFFTGWGALESVADETAGYLSNTPARIISGTWRIVTTTIRGVPTKAIKCVSSGRLAIPAALFYATPAEAAFGGWRFWLYNQTQTLTPRVYFVASSTGDYLDPGQTGYLLQINSVQQASFRKMTGGASSLMVAGTTGLFPVADWALVDIGRRFDGQAAYWQDGVQDLVATDASYATSQQLVFDLDTGDMASWGDPVGGHGLTKTLGPPREAA